MENEVGFFEEKVKKFKKKYDDINVKTANIKLMCEYRELLSKLKKIMIDLNCIQSMNEFIVQYKVDFVIDTSYKNIIDELDGLTVDGNTDNITRLEDIIVRLDRKLYEQILMSRNKCNDFLIDLFNDKKSVLDCFNQTNQLAELNRKENEIKTMGIKKETVVLINKYVEEKNKLFDSLGIGDDIAEILLKLNEGSAVLDDINCDSIKKWFCKNDSGKQIESRIRLQLS